jgi:hypothetical protein
MGMKTLEVQLSEQTASKLEEAAERLSLTSEELLLLSIEEKLAQLDAEFGASADYVLKKNEELYRRLA